MTTPLLRAENVSVRFGGVLALDDVTFDAFAGQVTCLVGDNGAGKSTLIRVLSGVHQPTSGAVFVAGRPVRFDSPRAALAHGIATVHQDLALVPLMSVWRNFHLGQEPATGWGPLRRVDVERARSVAVDALSAFGITVDDPDRVVGTMSGGERQAIAIARAVHRGARALILDEPTAALGTRQAAIVLDTIATLRDRGSAVILITHDPAQAARLADRTVTLEHGRVAGVDPS